MAWRPGPPTRRSGPWSGPRTADQGAGAGAQLSDRHLRLVPWARDHRDGEVGRRARRARRSRCKSKQKKKAKKKRKKCKKAKGKKGAKDKKTSAKKRCKSKNKKCRKANGHLYVFAGSAGSPVEGRFSLPCVGNAKAAVVGENRTVPVRKGPSATTSPTGTRSTSTASTVDRRAALALRQVPQCLRGCPGSPRDRPVSQRWTRTVTPASAGRAGRRSSVREAAEAAWTSCPESRDPTPTAST